MAAGGVVIVGEQAFGRACISMALAPFMSEVPVLYCGSSIDDALLAVERRPLVTAVLDVDGELGKDIAAMAKLLSQGGCRVVVVAGGDAVQVISQLSPYVVDVCVSKRTSGIGDVVQAVFERESPMSHGRTMSVPLTQMQRRVLALFATGSSCRDIGQELGVSTETVKTHLKRLRAKYEALGIHVPARSDLYRVAVMSGVIV